MACSSTGRALRKLCEGCGEARRFLLVVHHKDGNRNNNLRSNLECVCHNCHALRHLKLVDGGWIYCSKVLTPTWAIGIDGNTPPLHGGVAGSMPALSTNLSSFSATKLDTFVPAQELYTV